MILRSLFAAALVFGSVTSASAFDMPPPIDAPEYTGTIAGVGGWYIRGDLGYNASIKGDKPTQRAYDFDINAPGYTSSEFDKARFDKDLTLNAGIGYQFNDFLRADFTVDYFKSTLNGKSDWANCTSVDGTLCSFRKEDMSAMGLLANGYVDLGTYWGLTPYAGAGAGVSYVKWGDVDQSVLCTKCDEVDYKMTTSSGSDSWRFTYALMAGVSYDIASNIKLDVGYRFSQVAGGDMFNFNAYESAFGATGAKAKENGFVRHEFRTGVRVVGW